MYCWMFSEGLKVRTSKKKTNMWSNISWLYMRMEWDYFIFIFTCLLTGSYSCFYADVSEQVTAIDSVRQLIHVFLF